MAAASIVFFAAVFTAKLVAVIVAMVAGKIVAGKIVDAKIVVAKILVGKILPAKIGCASSAGFACGGAKIGQNGLLPNLALAQRGEIVGHGFFFVEPDL